MAAPKGNRFWEKRSKHGCNKLFANPKLLWEAACEYFQYCIDNPWQKSEAIKSGESCGKIIKVPTARPFTEHGLCLYLGCNTKYFAQFMLRLKDKNDKRSKDFANVITQIKEIIYMQKFEGAAVGAFNANLISRELGLQDQHTLNHTGGIDMPAPVINIINSGPQLASDEKEVEGYEDKNGAD